MAANAGGTFEEPYFEVAFIGEDSSKSRAVQGIDLV